MIAAEILAGSGLVLRDCTAGREIKEIEGVGVGRGKDTTINLGLGHLLDGGVVHGFARFGRIEIKGADPLAVGYAFAGDAVLRAGR